MEYVTISAQQAAERLLSIRCAFILFAIIAICFTIWCINTNRKAAECSKARSEAMKLRVHDNNRKERKEWIEANCELAAQVEQLKAAVRDLTCENDRMRDILRVTKFSDVKAMKEGEKKA